MGIYLFEGEGRGVGGGRGGGKGGGGQGQGTAGSRGDPAFGAQSHQGEEVGGGRGEGGGGGGGGRKERRRERKGKAEPSPVGKENIEIDLSIFEITFTYLNFFRHQAVKSGAAVCAPHGAYRYTIRRALCPTAC